MAPSTETGKQSLDGLVAVVTGGGKGVGRTISAELAREGADVAVLAGRDLASAEATAAELRALGRRAIALVADVTSPDSIENAMAKIEAEFGRIDLLVNNAGHSVYAPLESLAVADWDAVFAVNAKGTFLASVAAARRMIPRNRGAIVNIAGASAHRSFVGAGAYGPSKAAVVNLTTQMALEWAKYGIRVNGVSPGPIRDEDYRLGGARAPPCGTGQAPAAQAGGIDPRRRSCGRLPRLAGRPLDNRTDDHRRRRRHRHLVHHRLTRGTRLAREARQIELVLACAVDRIS